MVIDVAKGNDMQQPEFPILIVDDIHTNLVFLEGLLKKEGIDRIIPCRDSREVMGILENRPVEIILLDLRMPHLDGRELLEKIRDAYETLPVIIITDVSDVTTAVQCIRMGAFDYITKPVDRDLFRSTVAKALSHRRLQHENQELRRIILAPNQLAHPEAFSDIVTRNESMFRIFKYIEAVGKTGEPVLITGETGVGKELTARAIHRISGLTGPMVSLNIAGLDDSVFSDTLFGHAKGAFTGADSQRAGLIEKAAGGTLFLDEIGDLSPPSQVKLLRLLQEGEYFSLGSDAVKRSKARVVVATNEDIWTLQRNGQMRADLIYRLKTHHIHLPTLSERTCDLPLLIRKFAENAASRLEKSPPVVTSSAVAFLENYRFPGNIRELQGMVFDAVSRNDSGPLSVKDFRPYCLTNHFKTTDRMDLSMEPDSSPPDTIRFPAQLPTIKEVTDVLVNEAMRRAGQNQSRAAALLGISQPALNKRLKNLQTKPEHQA